MSKENIGAAVALFALVVGGAVVAAPAESNALSLRDRRSSPRLGEVDRHIAEIRSELEVRRYSSSDVHDARKAFISALDDGHRWEISGAEDRLESAYAGFINLMAWRLPGHIDSSDCRRLARILISQDTATWRSMRSSYRTRY